MENPLIKYKGAIEVAKKKPKGMVLSYENVLAEVAEYAAHLEAENERLESDIKHLRTMLKGAYMIVNTDDVPVGKWLNEARKALGGE